MPPPGSIQGGGSRKSRGLTGDAGVMLNALAAAGIQTDRKSTCGNFEEQMFLF